MKRTVLITAVVTTVICVLTAALLFVSYGRPAETGQVAQWREQIRMFRVFKEEQQLELDILRIQTEIAQLKTARTPAVTPQQLGGEFVPLDQLPPEHRKP